MKIGKAATVRMEKRKIKRKREKGMAAISRLPLVMAKPIKKPKVRITQRVEARSKKLEMVAFKEMFFINSPFCRKVAQIILKSICIVAQREKNCKRAVQKRKKRKKFVSLKNLCLFC